MGKDQKPPARLSRRDFITGMAVTAAAAGAGAAALSPLIKAEEVPSLDDFLQQHYQRLTLDQKKVIFARLESEINVDLWRQSHRWRSAAAGRGGVWLCPEYRALQRVP